VRRWLIPSNPKTAAQTETRSAFSWLNNFARYLPSGALGAWQLYADNSLITVRNAIIKQNLGALRGEVDLNNLIASPAAGGGLVAQAIALTPGANSITVDLTEPDLPTGWTIANAWALAIRDQDPQTEAFYVSVAGSDATTPYQIVLSGLTSAVLYQVAGWFEYVKPDGKTAYGIALLDSDTPS